MCLPPRTPSRQPAISNEGGTWARRQASDMLGLLVGDKQLTGLSNMSLELVSGADVQLGLCRWVGGEEALVLSTGAVLCLPRSVRRRVRGCSALGM